MSKAITMKAAIILRGGLIQEIITDEPGLECIVLDYDVTADDPTVEIEGDDCAVRDPQILYDQGRVHDLHTQAQVETADDLLREAIEHWPQLDGDGEVSGGDLVEWFADFRERAKRAAS